ncbi:hypothetical protein [Pseudochryseolinea flava]|nr:hypothetical protein [Pseudochryseolinea flava]
MNRYLDYTLEYYRPVNFPDATGCYANVARMNFVLSINENIQPVRCVHKNEETVNPMTVSSYTKFLKAGSDYCSG